MNILKDTEHAPKDPLNARLQSPFESALNTLVKKLE